MNKRATVLIAVVVALALVGVGIWVIALNNNPVTETQTTTTQSPSNNTPPSGGATEPQATTDKITIENFAFTPPSITVKKGTKVTWTNKDSVVHTVEPDSGAPSGGPTNSGDIGKDGQYSFTFDAVGTFSYHCGPHPYMKGKVIVVE